MVMPGVINVVLAPRNIKLNAGALPLTPLMFILCMACVYPTISADVIIYCFSVCRVSFACI